MATFTAEERRRVAAARVGRLATADAEGRPNVVPCCFALRGERVVTPVDEKPKRGSPSDLRRVRDVRANPYAALVVDRYAEDWSALWWVQVRGTAAALDPGDGGHADAVAALREKYDQYADHALEERPVLELDPGHVVSWSGGP